LRQCRIPILAGNTELIDQKRHMLARHDLLRALGWTGVVVAAFVLSRPYDGIKHDGVLYLAQALSRLYPDIFRGDVFFLWGSQDSYTLFTPLYAWLIHNTGLNKANLALVLLSQGAFLAASFTLVRSLVPTGRRGFAMLFIVCGTGIYGPALVFRMAEPFVTPRPFVEALTLFSVALLAFGHRGWSLLLLAIGAALHPLVSLAGMIYWWVYQTILDRRWAWLLVAGVAPAAAGLAGIAPFTQLFLSFDDQWLQILLENNYNLFVTRWTLQDWTFVAFDLFILALGARVANDRLQIALKAAIATALIGIGATFVGADLLQNVLLADIQVWRVLWLAHWMAVAALPVVAVRMWNEGVPGRLIAGLVVFGFVTRGLPTSLAALFVAGILFHFRARFAVGERILQAGLAALAAGAYMNWFNNSSREHESAFFDAINPIADFVVRSLSKPFALLVIATGLAWFGLTRRPASLAAIGAVVLALLVCGVWDQRTPYRTYIESAPIGSHPFSRFVGPHEEVLWHGDLVAPWVMMLRRSYFSVAQQSGQMFNRDTAIDLQKRGGVLALLDLQETVCAIMNKLNRLNDACEPDLQVVQEVCREAPQLGHIVLTTRIEGKWTSFWTPPVEFGGRRADYYLYECKALVRD
jgi:hypothetical protein